MRKTHRQMRTVLSIAAAAAAMLVGAQMAAAQCSEWTAMPNQSPFGLGTITGGEVTVFNDAIVLEDETFSGTVLILEPGADEWSEYSPEPGFVGFTFREYEGELYFGTLLGVARTVNGDLNTIEYLGPKATEDFPSVEALVFYNGDVIAGGNFTQIGGVAANNIARWDGKQWHELGGGTDDQVNTMTVYDGELIVGGRFQTVGTTPASTIARWNGQSWAPMGDGFSREDGNPAAVRALIEFEGSSVASKSLIAGGAFDHSGLQPMNRIARWNSVAGTWEQMDGGLPLENQSGGSVRAFANYAGDLIVGGNFFKELDGGEDACDVIRWSDNEDNPGWSIIEGLTSCGAVNGLARKDDQLIISGAYTVNNKYPNLANITLWTGQIPDFTMQPQNTFAEPGSDVMFQAAVGMPGGPAWTYEWRRDGVPLAESNNGNAVGYDTDTLMLTDVSEADLGVYDLIVYNLCGSKTSQPAALFLAGSTPSCPADITGDDVVGVSDLLELLSAWGACP